MITASIPSLSIAVGHTGRSKSTNELGMRAMQAEAYKYRGEQFLLIKSPPASGKSRALMYIALDKLKNQGVKQALILVPERSIGSSFSDEPLAAYGFWADWTVRPKWNLCAMPGGEETRSAATGKVKAVGEFLKSDDKALVCTHATFRFAVEALGIEAFDDRLIAIDEFHHVSVNEANVLGGQLKELLNRGKVHVVAMTGSYFRGDTAAVLSPEDESRFATVTYTYYEQLNGYEYLKSLDLGYWFYSGSYLEAIGEVLDPKLKTIVHIPNVNSSASSTDKYAEVDQIMGVLGDYEDRDPITDFHLVRNRATGRILKIADLVDDYDSNRRSKVLAALRDPAHRNDRDHVDVIIALGMAKEGFDWIWCEHALTVGYRSSLTEIVQIIGRVTRDAPGKTRAKFTNLIAEPLADQSDVVEAVNDTLKAIAASLLMEQVIAPRFDFTPKDSGPKPGYDYGTDGYKKGETNVGVNEENGIVHIEIKGLKEMSPEAARICREDLNDVIAAVVQDKETLSQGLFNAESSVPQETTQLRIPKIIRDRYPDLPEEDVEAIRQRAVAALTLVQTSVKTEEKINSNLGLLEGVRRFVLHVRELSVDLIDAINPFGEAYAVLGRTLNAKILEQMKEKIAAKKVSIPEDEALELARRALEWQREKGRPVQITSADAWERRLAEGVAAYRNYVARKKAKAAAAGETA
jgi:superfamily II DNA or RNA helicase